MHKNAFFFLLLFIFAFGPIYAQEPSINFPKNQAIEKELARLRTAKLDVANLRAALQKWEDYPMTTARKETLYHYKDSTYGDIKVKVYIPEQYDAKRPTKLILLLHGAVGHSEAEGEDIFFDAFSKKDYIIVRPLADNSKNFNWVVNRYKGNPNPTFTALADIVKQLKFSFNIDDNKIFAYGHSDGADGAFGLQLFAPTLFSGFVVYNSMFTNIFDTNFFITNAVNRPLYAVHSSLDDLRPIEQTRKVIDFLKSKSAPLQYREYIGFQHYDKHLHTDMPLSEEFMEQKVRQVFPPSVYMETNNERYNQCDWLKVFPKQGYSEIPEDSELTVMGYNKIKKIYTPSNYRNGPRSLAKAEYRNNTFTCTTKGISKIHLLIDPIAVDFKKPVIVIVNGKQVYKAIVKADRDFMLDNFRKHGDKTRLYVNMINVEVGD